MAQRLNILTSDFLIADIIFKLKTFEEIEALEDAAERAKLHALNEKVQSLMDKKGLSAGGKGELKPHEYEDMIRTVENIPADAVEPGGSSANTLVTLKKLFPELLGVNFLGVAGPEGGEYSKKIREALDAVDVKLVVDGEEINRRAPEGETPMEARSYVFVLPEGKITRDGPINTRPGERVLMTYPGNAKHILTPDMVTDERVAQNDIVFMQGSMWQKIDKLHEQHGDNFVYADMFGRKRWDQDKQLWLALPTHAKFGEERADLFQYIIPSANVVMGNIEELSRIAGDPIRKGDSEEEVKRKTEAALRRLQEAFNFTDDAHNGQTVLKFHGKAQPREQVGFITMGDKGAAWVTREGFEFVDAVPTEVTNTLGAGDTSFAGFAAGYLSGMSFKESAELGMELASLKLQRNGPRLADPMRELEKTRPDMAESIKKNGITLFSSPKAEIHASGVDSADDARKSLV